IVDAVARLQRATECPAACGRRREVDRGNRVIGHLDPGEYRVSIIADLASELDRLAVRSIPKGRRAGGDTLLGNSDGGTECSRHAVVAVGNLLGIGWRTEIGSANHDGIRVPEPARQAVLGA